VEPFLGFIAKNSRLSEDQRRELLEAIDREENDPRDRQ